MATATPVAAPGSLDSIRTTRHRQRTATFASATDGRITTSTWLPTAGLRLQ
jgi:hypothetical protein